METKRTIIVTAEDLKQPYADSRNCPIATAFKRHFPEDAEYVSVGGSYVRTEKECWFFDVRHSMRVVDLKNASKFERILLLLMGKKRQTKIVLTK